MKVRYIAFKWHVDAPIEAIPSVLEQVGFRPGKKHIWSRSVGDHTLQVEFREQMSSRDRSYFWLRFFNAKAPTDKVALDRVLTDWYFTLSRHFPTYINWMQVALDLDEFRPIYGFAESSPKVWSKTDKQVRFSVFPYQDHYLFEVKNEDIRKTIQHNRYAHWLDDLKHNLLGHERPDDQIRFDLVV